MTIEAVLRSPGGVAKSVAQLMDRLLPAAAGAFRLRLAPDLGADTFELSGGGDMPVQIRGDTPVSVAAGLNWYLKHYCHVHFSWCGDQLALPAQLPALPETVRITSPYRWRYYFNYCTFSYSMAFWDWPRWEREIDWMALSGINLPLAIVGQEAVWQRVYRKLGLNDVELGEFFTGPAFLAWGWMGNIDGWGGPTPQSWIDGQCHLQKRILQRMRQLGMRPVLPAFTGHVPPALVRHFPELKVRQMENWAETFTGTCVLDPTDPMFQRIGTMFIEEQRAIYGSDDDDGPHFYSCDTFNENSPPDDDPAYLADVARRLYSAMAAADPAAVWVLQDWMFHFNPTNPGFWKQPQVRAFLDAIPDDRLLVLDLHSDAFPLAPRTEALCGKPWAWCFLHSFGGRQAMFGNLQRLAEDPPAALASPASGQLVGFGLTPEGIEQNPVLYDLATDMMWRRQAPDVTRWMEQYIQRRYGVSHPAASRAWGVLRQTVYSRPPECGATVTTPLNCAPGLRGGNVTLNYPLASLLEAWEQLVIAAPDLGHSDPFRFDLVDVARQVLVSCAATLQAEAAAAFDDNDPVAFRTVGNRFITLIHDVDRLLATRREFLLGRWLEAAKAWGTDPAEQRLMEQNARRQITLWGDETSMLRDYGRKDWAGMMRAFYAVRWQRFFDHVATCLERGEAFDEPAFHRQLREWEERWIHQTDAFPTEPVGDSVAIATLLLEKYRHMLPVRMSLSTGKPAAASASRRGHGPELAVSGRAERFVFWAAREGPHWWQVDLGEVLPVDAVHVFTRWDGQRSYVYELQTSTDGQAWTAASSADDTAPATHRGRVHRFATRPTRFVRVVMQDRGVNSINLLDVRVYGPACPLADG